MCARPMQYSLKLVANLVNIIQSVKRLSKTTKQEEATRFFVGFSHKSLPPK